MTQDFAKIRPEPILERKPVETPPAWSLMLTGIVVGMALGIFACFMFYLSGNVPPLNPANTLSNNPAAVEAQSAVNPIDEEPAKPELELEFYTALPEYEVPTDGVIPVPLTDEQKSRLTGNPVVEVVEVVDEPLKESYMLQAGAFQQQDSATSEMQRQQALGLSAIVKREALNGRILYLVQSGPYTTSDQLDRAENLLRANNIPSLRSRLQ